MKVLIAGATGAVGSRLFPLLVAAGHRVAGLTRSPAKVEALRRAGVEARVVDAFDRNAVRAAVLEARPEVVVHEMTALPNASDLVHFDRAFATTNRLRTEALDHLIAAAEESGARRFVAQSFCGWPYARTGGPVKAEDDPLDPDPPREMRRTLDAIRHLECPSPARASSRAWCCATAPSTGRARACSTDRSSVSCARRRAPMIGDGGGLWSFLHLDDAASATALGDRDGRLRRLQHRRRRARSGARMAAGARRHARRQAAAPHSRLGRADRGRRASGGDDDREPRRLERKAREALGWRPAYASWRQGFADVIASGG